MKHLSQTGTPAHAPAAALGLTPSPLAGGGGGGGGGAPARPARPPPPTPPPARGGGGGGGGPSPRAAPVPPLPPPLSHKGRGSDNSLRQVSSQHHLNQPPCPPALSPTKPCT